MNARTESPHPAPSPRAYLSGSPITAGLAGMAAVLGWMLLDLAVFLGAGPPSTFLALLPGCAVALALGALLGVAWRSRVFLLGTASVFLVASLVPFLTDPQVSRAVLWIPRDGFLLLCAYVSAAWLSPRVCRQRSGRAESVSLFLIALLLGVLACGLKMAYRHPLPFLPLGLIGAAAGALVLGVLTRGRLLTAATLLSIALPLGLRFSRSVESDRIPRPDLPAAPPTQTGAPNLILIVLDTVRADRLAPYGYGRRTTPALDAFVAEHMTRFTQAHSNCSWTLPSHASLFTGLLPAQHGATNTRTETDETLHLALRPAQPLAPEFTTIAEMLRDRGYRTGAIVANCAYLDYRFGLAQGFEHFDDRVGARVGTYIALAQLGGFAPEVGRLLYRNGEAITNEALEWLGRVPREDQPFFLFLNYMDAHEPYIPPRRFNGAFGDPDPIDPLKSNEADWSVLYDRALLSLDSQLGRLLGRLASSAFLENTVLVITSDHGQGLGTHGFQGHAWTLTEDVVRVPLYLKPAGGRTDMEDARPIDGAGVHDLLLDLLGLPHPITPRPFPGPVAELFRGAASPGIERWAEESGRDIEADYLAWFDGPSKWIVSSHGDVRVFDLADDPGESRPLTIEPEERAAALERAHAWWEANPPRASASTELPADLSERMDALGYTGR